MNNLIKLEFKRWNVVKHGVTNGNAYRISKYSPNGVFKEFTASVLCVGEYLPFTAPGLDFAGHATLEAAETAVKAYIETYMKSNSNMIGMDY